MECSICCDTFNKLSRKQIICLYCNYSSCTSCNQTYLLDSVHEAHCSNCRKVWTLTFMNENFTKKFLTKDYRDKREIVYFKEEESHFPALLPRAEQRKQIMNIDDQVTQLEREMFLNDQNEDQMVRDQRVNDRTLKIKRDTLRRNRHVILSRDVTRERREVIMKCPLGECKGFLNSKMYCGICDSHICKDCHVKKTGEKDETHECNQDVVATVTELRRSTKPCPNCHTPIFKTDGCDQMFCTQCHTPFSWRTGKVETGVIHNPHYFEALRRGVIQHQRHQPHQGGCGPMRDARSIRTFLRSFYSNEKVPDNESILITEDIFYFYQQMTHHRAVTLPLFTRVDNREEERIKFMIGMIEEKKFKQRLYVHHQTSIRKLEEQQIVDMYVNTGEELFRTIDDKNVLDILKQLRLLRDLTFDAITEIDKKYQHKGHVKPVDIKRI
jgi:hypothetical protein